MQRTEECCLDGTGLYLSCHWYKLTLTNASISSVDDAIERYWMEPVPGPERIHPVGVWDLFMKRKCNVATSLHAVDSIKYLQTILFLE